ncbi:MAG TPA: glutathione S-transferase N-terminal domain-containing protein [Burkholderiaceae bacterium]|nr:glutathione S-transferase N-terminal domain-containing protein [Burkholderiaceae bacterium]
MKLYYLPGACPLASHIVLEWIGKPYEIQKVGRDELKQPAYLALNPLGAVPTLVDGDFVLTQSAAILEYLAEQNPQLGLMPEDLRERAETRRWLGFCNADLHRTFALIFGVQAYSDDPAVQEQLTEKTAAKLVQLFSVANKQLEGKKWLTGVRSVADPYLYTLLRWAKAKKLKLDEMANLKAFHAHMEADPAVQAALKAQGLS